MPNSYHDISITPGNPPSVDTVDFNSTDLKYLETAHLQLIATNTTSGESQTFLQTENTPFTVSVVSGTTTINIAPIKASFPTNANRIRVARVTPSENLLTNFVNSSLLRAEDLNQNSEQLLFVLQEQIDAGTGSLPLTAADEFDAGTRNIINLKDGLSDKDAVNFGQLSAIAGGITNSPSVPQVYSFALGLNGGGTVSGANTTFTLSPAPTSNIDGTFIVEVAGVIQRPGTDFTVNGNVLTLLNTDLTDTAFDNTSIIIQNFGVSRDVFSFPVTGEAVSNTETPLTLKGAASGDATALLDVKDSSGTSNTTISAGGTVKARVVEPFTSGTLAVNPTTLTTTGNVSSGGTLSVGSNFNVAQSGDVTANKITLGTTSGFGTNDVVTKAYVDSSGGAGGTFSSETNLNTLTAPQRSSGVVPSNPSDKNYPAGVSAGEAVILIVNRLGGAGSGAGTQELQVLGPSTGSTQQVYQYHRLFDGSTFSDWFFGITNRHGVNDLAAPSDNLSMNNKKIVSLADPTFANHATTKAYVDDAVSTKGDIKRSVKACGHVTLTRNSGSNSGQLSSNVDEGFNLTIESATYVAATSTTVNVSSPQILNANMTPIIYATNAISSSSNSVAGPWTLVTNHTAKNYQEGNSNGFEFTLPYAPTNVDASRTIRLKVLMFSSDQQV